MAPKRGDGSKKRKDSLRFVLIGPKPPNVLKLSSRLFLAEASGVRRGAPSGSSRRSRPVPNLRFSRRLAAALIASAFLCAGLAMLAACVRDDGWLVGVLGAAAAVYGIAWVPVAYRGRSAGGRLRFAPWRRE